MKFILGCGLKSKKLKPINVYTSHPTILSHLSKYKHQLINRIDKGDDWTNLRNYVYFPEFEKEKIVFTKASKI